MRYKAIFFDRDGTLVYNNPVNEKWRNQLIAEWSGKPFELPYEKFIDLFMKTKKSRPGGIAYRNVDDEKVFFREFYRLLLLNEGISDNIEARADMLFERLWCYNNMLIYPETIEVLEYFAGKGYKMGVISDTSPSLELSLQKLGLARYFTSFTASSMVGAGKPSPIIFNAALKDQGVSAQESVFVDDTRIEAQGAREQGFTSFWLDRNGETSGSPWTIRNLNALIDFVQNLR